MLKILERRLERAGIIVNGPHPWDPKIRVGYDARLTLRLALWGTLGLGEAYMDGWWECDDLVGFFDRAIVGLDSGPTFTLDELSLAAKTLFFNLQKGSHAFEVGKNHYDVRNDRFKITLDPTMTYTCAFFENGITTLEEAQKYKRRYSLAKLKPEPGMSLLEIGCGWGYFAKEAAEAGMKVVGITVSEEQAEFARKLCKGLDVLVLLCPYESIPSVFNRQFDRVASFGMFEHVGTKNYRSFAKTVAGVLKPQGLELLHTIVRSGEKEQWVPRGNPWLHKYIFPNGVLPSEAEIAKSNEALLIRQNQENFGLHYARTLSEWRKNYLRGYRLLDNYNERAHRKWIFYLSMCEAVFRTGRAQLCQYVYSKGVLDSVYIPPPRAEAV